MKDRLNELLQEHDVLYGMICRDATLTDIELLAQAGFHVIWLDLEHSPQSTAEALRLSRSICHLGMVPLVRILELTRTHVQCLLDGGVHIVNLPDIRSPEQATQFVQLGKYPPIGQRGVSSTSVANDYTLGPDPEQTLRETNQATHLMTMFESDEAYEQLDAILEVEGIDIITIGPADWSIGLGIFGEQAKKQMTPRIKRVFVAAREAGKITAMTVSTADQADYYHQLGVRVFFVGPDIAIKRRVFRDTIDPIKSVHKRRPS